jgi:transmembrane sensor
MAVKTNGSTRSRQAAADWVVKLATPQVAEADWLAFDAWLRAAPDNRGAYDETLSLWLELDAVAAAGGAESLGPPNYRLRLFVAPPSAWWATGAVVALTAIAVSSAVYLRPAPRLEQSSAVYATARGEQLSARLADGTRIDLAGASRLLVRFDGHHRNVTMTSGEAAFAVTHDPRRPFIVAVGDRRVQDVGTEFDIRRGPSDVAVTVRQGLVQVEPAAGALGSPISVGPGRRLRHQDGSARSDIESVTPENIFAWKTGRLVYRDQPLQDVADDLNRYFTHPLRIEGDKVADLRFTGVLRVDAEAPTVERLTALLPVSATPANGAIILRLRETPR